MDHISQGSITTLLSQIDFIKIGMIDDIQLSDINDSGVSVEML